MVAGRLRSDARSALTNPRSRLEAELAWMPGASPGSITRFIQVLETDPLEAGELLDRLNGLSRLNGIVSILSALKSFDAGVVGRLIVDAADAYEAITIETLFLELNEDRQLAGFALVPDKSVVEESLQARRQVAKDAFIKTLDRLPTRDLIALLTEVVEQETSFGDEECPTLIADLADAYHLRAITFLSEESESIRNLVLATQELAKLDSRSGLLTLLVRKIQAHIKSWDEVAQPVQVLQKSRGQRHEESQNLALAVRGLAVVLNNDASLSLLAKQLTTSLQEVFAEVPDVLERLDEDADALERILQDQQRSAQDKEEERKKISCDVEMGTIFNKKRLVISPESIIWKNKHYMLDDIRSIWWGGTRNNYGIKYEICFSSLQGRVKISPENSSQFETITASLWRGVGVRLLFEAVEELRHGGHRTYGSISVTDEGAYLPRATLFGSKGAELVRWRDLRSGPGNGSVILESTRDKDRRGEVHLLETENAPVFNVMVSSVIKSGKTHLSDVFLGAP